MGLVRDVGGGKFVKGEDMVGEGAVVLKSVPLHLSVNRDGFYAL